MPYCCTHVPTHPQPPPHTHTSSHIHTCKVGSFAASCLMASSVAWCSRNRSTIPMHVRITIVRILPVLRILLVPNSSLSATPTLAGSVAVEMHHILTTQRTLGKAQNTSPAVYVLAVGGDSIVKVHLADYTVHFSEGRGLVGTSITKGT